MSYFDFAVQLSFSLLRGDCIVQDASTMPAEFWFNFLRELFVVCIHHEQLPAISSNYDKQGLGGVVCSPNDAGGCGSFVGCSLYGLACVC